MSTTVPSPRRLALGLLAAAALSLAAAESASASSTWTGRIEGSVSRGSRWVSGGATARGDFRIVVADNGQVTGNGVVAYEPTFQSTGLDALLGYAKDVAGSAFGLIPYFGGFGTAAVNTFVSVDASYEPLVVREGTITGTYDGATLSLKWNGDTSGVPFRASILAIKKDVKLTSGRLAVPQPLRGAGRVIGGSYAVSSTRTSKPDDGGVVERETSYWSAARVS